MLLSRRRSLEMLPETPALRRRPSPDRLVDETWYLRDLLDGYSGGSSADGADVDHHGEQQQQRRHQVLAFLRRRNRVPDHDALDDSLQRSRARMSSQELFLGVVLEWQRSATEGAHSQPRAADTDPRFARDEPTPHSHRSFFPPTAYSYAPSAQSSSESDASSDASSSDSELENIDARHTKRQHLMLIGEEVSPTSVHNVPRELTPLNLDFVLSAAAAPKRIGVYTPRSRQELLRKYMTKRAKRLSQNKVRYRVRKTLANARPRVKGRFVKTEQPLTVALAESMGGSQE